MLSVVNYDEMLDISEVSTAVYAMTAAALRAFDVNSGTTPEERLAAADSLIDCINGVKILAKSASERIYALVSECEYLKTESEVFCHD